MRESSEPSRPSSPQLSDCRACRHWGLTLIQIGVAAAIWDLTRIGKLQPTHAIVGLLLLAVPGAATKAVGLYRAYRSPRGE